MPPAAKNNIAFYGFVITAVGAVVTIALFVAPLKTLPGDVKEVRDTQIAQTEVLKSLAKVAEKSEEIRRDVDRNTTDIRHLHEAVNKLEARP